MKDRIYTMYMGKQSFTNQNHLENFLKYLFSKSQKHKKNEKTKENFIGDSLQNYQFIDDNYESMFKIGFKDILNYDNVFNDLTYVSFAINIDDNIITNILEKENDEYFSTLDPITTQNIIDDYYDNDESSFEQDINQIFTDAKDIIPFSTIKDFKLKEQIELKILSTLCKRNSENTFFSISHNDQEQMYHIHRLNRIK